MPDPNEMTVNELTEYVEENPEEAADLLEQEKAGKNRAGAVRLLEDVLKSDGDEESPEPASDTPAPASEGPALSDIGTVEGAHRGGAGPFDVSEEEGDEGDTEEAEPEPVVQSAIPGGGQRLNDTGGRLPWLKATKRPGGRQVTKQVKQIYTR